jgi:hypothetical protein
MAVEKLRDEVHNNGNCNWGEGFVFGGRCILPPKTLFIEATDDFVGKIIKV